MLVFCAVVGLVVRDAEAYDWQFAEVFFVLARIQEVLEKLSVQIAEVFGNAKARLSSVVIL